MHKKLRVVGCVLQYNNQILLVQRNSNKPEGGQRGLPAGKVDEGETDNIACIREISEEISVGLEPKNLLFRKNFTFHFAEKIVYFPTFLYNCEDQPTIILKDDELSNYKRFTIQDALDLTEKILGLEEILLELKI